MYNRILGKDHQGGRIVGLLEWMVHLQQGGAEEEDTASGVPSLWKI